MEHCEICGKEHATNFTWSEEWVCDSCIEWIDIEEKKVKREIYQYPVREY
jgi:ribosome-binding protein aMBF1 (putative translation factor)